MIRCLCIIEGDVAVLVCGLGVLVAVGTIGYQSGAAYTDVLRTCLGCILEECCAEFCASKVVLFLTL